MGISGLPGEPTSKKTLLILYRLWRNAQTAETRRLAGWAFGTQPLHPRDTFEADAWENDDDNLDSKQDSDWAGAILLLAWYRKQPSNDEQLLQKLKLTLDEEDANAHRAKPANFRLLQALGKPGQHFLDEWKRSAKNLDLLPYPIRQILNLD